MTKVTVEQVRDFIESVEYRKFGNKTTVAFARLKNGFEIVTSSSCVDPQNYSEDIGKTICMERLENKVWEVLGFELQCRLAKVTESESVDG